MTDARDEGIEGGSDAATSGPVRYPTAIALGGGVAAAVGSSFIPMNAIEGFVSAYGIAELLPAAAPPLGNTARLALSAGIGTLTAGALLALLPRGGTDDMGFESAITTNPLDADGNREATAATGFGATRLGGWLRALRFGKGEAAEGEITEFSELNRLRIRNGDHHPDAPARAPISALSDLGAPLDAAAEPVAAAEFAEPVASEDAGAPFNLDASMAFAPPPMEEVAADAEPMAVSPSPSLRFSVHSDHDWQEAQTAEESADDDVAAKVDAVPAVDEPAPAVAAIAGEPFAELSIPALLERLEQGLARRREQADNIASQMTAESAVPSRVVPISIAASPVFAEPEASSEPAAEMPLRRFRISKPDTATPTEPAMEVIAEADISPVNTAIWDTGVEYQAPSISPGNAPTSEMAEAPHRDQPSEAAEASTSPASADDDMDAALRDALATLRQLSDRQRNV